MMQFEKDAAARNYIDITPLAKLQWKPVKRTRGGAYVSSENERVANYKLFITPRGRVVRYARDNVTGSTHCYMWLYAPVTNTNGIQPYIDALKAEGVPSYFINRFIHTVTEIEAQYK